MSLFVPADILIPNVPEMEKWSVIACDQFTSQPEYWIRVEEYVSEAPSALKMIYPEAKLTKKEPDQEIFEKIRTFMEHYLKEKVFKEYPASFVYTERTLCDGQIRKGIVGAVDLKCYDYHKGSHSEIRATEATVLDRIPPRRIIRENALLEFPHILLFADDESNKIWDYIEHIKENLFLLYDFELMENGGHIKGRLVDGIYAQELKKKLEDYEVHSTERWNGSKNNVMMYAVADGNHSLAAAKAHYDDLIRKGQEDSPARFALAELVNVRDQAQKFEPIHRIIKNTDPHALLKALKQSVCTEKGIPIQWHLGEECGKLFLDEKQGSLAVEILQKFLDEYLLEHPGEVDYIHGEEVLLKLSKQEGAIGFLMPGIEKDSFFEKIMKNGTFPRKTFSLGHAVDKRYYLEGRRLTRMT